MLYWMMACRTLDMFLCRLLDLILGPDEQTPADRQFPWGSLASTDAFGVVHQDCQKPGTSSSTQTPAAPAVVPAI
jgi:hypothetical protein